jgi:hypothetical protein
MVIFVAARAATTQVRQRRQFFRAAPSASTSETSPSTRQWCSSARHARPASVARTCHVSGASNARFYIPGMSRRPGTFDTTGALFNPRADNGVLEALVVRST